MYKLMLSYLLILFATAILLGAIGVLPYNPLHIFLSGLYVIAASFAFNQLCAFLLKVKPNVESQFITALIISLIVGPRPFLSSVVFLTFLAAVSIASKYLIAPNKRHIVNPAAFAVVVSAMFLEKGASWWIGNQIMFPFVLLGGLMVTQKIRRFNMVFAFLCTYLLFLLTTELMQGKTISILAQQLVNLFTVSPILFFSFVMLTEPLTSPSDSKLHAYFGIATALLLIFYQAFLKEIPYSLELSLVTANILTRAIKIKNENATCSTSSSHTTQSLTKP